MAYTHFTAMPVWQHALGMLVRVYKLTNNFPKEEKYGLTSDIRRAANSVCHNLAEGYGIFENKDKSRFYKISRGRAYEIISQTLAGHALNYMSIGEKNELVSSYKNIIDQLDNLILAIEKRKQPQTNIFPTK